MESRSGSLPPKSSDEWQSQLRLRNSVGQNFSPQVSCIAYVDFLQAAFSGKHFELRSEHAACKQGHVSFNF